MPVTIHPVRLPKGVRLNNPMNLRELPGDTTNWAGERATNDDDAFEEFDLSEMGVRAGAITLRNYKRLHGVDSIEKLVARYAPGVDNNDEFAYVQALCKATQVDPDEKIDLEDADFLFPLIKAIIAHEQGRAPRGWEDRSDGTWYADGIISRGIAMARVKPKTPVRKSATVQVTTGAAAVGSSVAVADVVFTAVKEGKTMVEAGSTVATALAILMVLVALAVAYRRWKTEKGSQ